MQLAAPSATPVRGLPAAERLLLVSFFLSGGSALVYQVDWQRALYAQIGVDIDSITIIVSVFMHSFAVDTGPRQAVIENRHGIISIFGGQGGDHAVYGGNVYDGRTNLDPVRNTNGLERPLLIATLQPQPRRVLMVGLSIGTWLALVREFPNVETIDVVEINPGYLQAAQRYPVQAAALRDPRVTVVVDDGRRWLRRHPERRYDMVIMNTTLHWRSNTTLLLSRQSLELLRSHMAPGAVLAFNATSSPDAFYTATRVFPHAYRYQNFVYAADFDFRPRKDAAPARAVYEAMRLGGQPYFPAGSPAIDRMLAQPFVTLAAGPRVRPPELITDENMITEFRYGRPVYHWFDFIWF